MGLGSSRSFGRDRGEPLTWESSSSSSVVWTMWRSADVAGHRAGPAVDGRWRVLRTRTPLWWMADPVHWPSTDSARPVPLRTGVVHSYPQNLGTKRGSSRCRSLHTSVHRLWTHVLQDVRPATRRSRISVDSLTACGQRVHGTHRGKAIATARSTTAAKWASGSAARSGPWCWKSSLLTAPRTRVQAVTPRRSSVAQS